MCRNVWRSCRAAVLSVHRDHGLEIERVPPSSRWNSGASSGAFRCQKQSNQRICILLLRNANELLENLLETNFPNEPKLLRKKAICLQLAASL